MIIKNKEMENVMAENQSKNETNTHTHRQATDIMVKLLKLPVTIGFTASDFSWHSASRTSHSSGEHEHNTMRHDIRWHRTPNHYYYWVFTNLLCLFRGNNSHVFMMA